VLNGILFSKGGKTSIIWSWSSELEKQIILDLLERIDVDFEIRTEHIISGAGEW